MVQGPGFAPMPPVQYEQEIVVRSYQLPDGKLKALTALMVRDDVPVLVRPLEDRIEVHATARQHKVFRAFVDMIHPPKECKEKAEPAEEASRAAPPDYFARTDPLTAYRDARKTRSNELAVLARLHASAGKQCYEEAAKAFQNALRVQRRADAETYAEQAATLAKLLDSVRGQARSREQDAAVMEAEAQALAQQAEELGARAKALVKRATELARAAEDVTDAAKARSLSEQVQALEKQGRELERQARELDKRSQAIERESRQAEDTAGELDDSADELEETLRVLQKHTECKPDK